MCKKIKEKNSSDEIKNLDNKLSKRFIELDPKGYFIIKLDKIVNEIIAEHYTNNIDNSGKAINPETGKPLTCIGGEKRQPLRTYRGKTAKDIGIKITEEDDYIPLSKLDHALYLGRELQKAEECLKNRREYVQD